MQLVRILYGFLVVALTAQLPAYCQDPAEPRVVRHAYQTAAYSEPFRRRCSSLTMAYLANLAKRNRMTSIQRAIDAGRSAETTRRAYQTKHRGTGLEAGTRRAYST